MRHRMAILTEVLVGLALAIGLLSAERTASAQPNHATINVPFDFTANDQWIPAGHYRVELVNHRWITLTDMKTNKQEATLLVIPDVSPKAEDRSHFVFVRQGDFYTLKEFKLAGKATHSNMLKEPQLEQD